MAMGRISITLVFLFQVPDRIRTRFWAKNVVFSKKTLFKQTPNLTDLAKMYIDGLTGQGPIMLVAAVAALAVSS